MPSYYPVPGAGTPALQDLAGAVWLGAAIRAYLEFKELDYPKSYHFDKDNILYFAGS